MLKRHHPWIALAFACCVVGCAAGPTIPGGGGAGLAAEQNRDVRALLDHQHRAQFLADRRRCLARGGRIVIQASSSLGRQSIPKRGDRYLCT
ncbi:MAG: hypothetical protein AAGE01_15050 [Pseudomonadota bacterium]